MDIRKVKKLIELLEESNIDEIEIKEGEESVRISRNGAQSMAIPQYLPQYAPPPQPLPAAAPAAPAAVEAAPAAAEPEGQVVRSPMVGTFYRSPSPDSDTFVKVGDHVDEETTVCIIEAMKVMNEIKADAKGIIQRIVAEDASPVQYGQALFIISPA